MALSITVRNYSVIAKLAGSTSLNQRRYFHIPALHRSSSCATKSSISAQSSPVVCFSAPIFLSKIFVGTSLPRKRTKYFPSGGAVSPHYYHSINSPMKYDTPPLNFAGARARLARGFEGNFARDLTPYPLPSIAYSFHLGRLGVARLHSKVSLGVYSLSFFSASQRGRGDGGQFSHAAWRRARNQNSVYTTGRPDC